MSHAAQDTIHKIRSAFLGKAAVTGTITADVTDTAGSA